MNLANSRHSRHVTVAAATLLAITFTGCQPAGTSLSEPTAGSSTSESETQDSDQAVALKEAQAELAKVKTEIGQLQQIEANANKLRQQLDTMTTERDELQKQLKVAQQKQQALIDQAQNVRQLLASAREKADAVSAEFDTVAESLSKMVAGPPPEPAEPQRSTDNSDPEPSEQGETTAGDADSDGQPPGDSADGQE